jgi:hypothetical protein
LKDRGINPENIKILSVNTEDWAGTPAFSFM